MQQKENLGKAMVKQLLRQAIAALDKSELLVSQSGSVSESCIDAGPFEIEVWSTNEEHALCRVLLVVTACGDAQNMDLASMEVGLSDGNGFHDWSELDVENGEARAIFELSRAGAYRIGMRHVAAG